jgi:PrtD family type I secretion system ABC transporter
VKPFFAYAGLFSLAINLLLLAAPLYMLQVFDRVLASRSQETLLVLTLATVGALLVMAALDAIRATLLVAAGIALDRRLGPRVLTKVLAHASTDPLALRDVNTLRNFLSGPGVIALFDAPWLPLFLLVILLFHPLLGVIAFAGAAVMLLLAFCNERALRKPLADLHGSGRKAGRYIDLATRNAEVIAGLGMLPAVTRRWTSMNEAALGAQRRAGGIGGGFSGLTKFTRQLIQVAMLAAGAWLVIEQQVTAGVMIAATILLGRALAPVELLLAGWRSLVEARAAWGRLGKVLNETSPETAHTELPAPAGSLQVEKVSFGVLRGVSFRLAAGESLGIIGPSAAGKSTLARLLIGVCKPAAGTVRLDGADVASWPREALGPHIGYLPQDVELFAGSVADNIARLGESDPTGVIRAAQLAALHELILRLPKGYDSDVAALSPGQCQRIALARALYGTPRVVVLDEPNANLDHEGDQALVAALRRLKEEGTTVVMVAHRPSLLAGVDKLLVLRDGVVEAFGARNDVMPRVTRAA